MATTTDLSVLRINYLTQAQYSTAVNNNTINPNELYFTPVSTLAVADGGTGITSNPSMLTNLASTTAASVFQANPRPGVTGILGMANGGTGNAYGLLPNNKGATSVNIGVGTWQPKSSTLSKYVWQQRWTTTDFTYTPSGGSATTNTDTADIGIWLSASETSNLLTANLNIDGRIYAMGGFDGGDCNLSNLLRITLNGNTTTIGSQNTSFCHIYNSASIPFIFNNSVLSVSGNLGSTAYPWNHVYLKTSSAIYAQGSQANYAMIQFIDNNTDTYGNGIVIGGGGQTIIGGGESAATAKAQAGTAGAETMWICNDGQIDLYANLQNGWSTAAHAYLNTSGYWYANRVYNAVWNDYAEFRWTKKDIEPGNVVIETGKGDMILSSERLQAGAKIVSDTYGTAMGETDKCKTPIAVAGRVLVYTLEDQTEFLPGDCICAGPNGKASKMTREEIIQWPDRIIGTVSEIPDYEIWGAENVKVNNRIWVYVR